MRKNQRALFRLHSSALAQRWSEIKAATETNGNFIFTKTSWNMSLSQTRCSLILIYRGSLCARCQKCTLLSESTQNIIICELNSASCYIFPSCFLPHPRMLNHFFASFCAICSLGVQSWHIRPSGHLRSGRAQTTQVCRSREEERPSFSYLRIIALNLPV